MKSRDVFRVDDRKRLIGLHGLILGCGEIAGKMHSRISFRRFLLSGGALFGFITKPKTSSQRGLMVLIGFLLQIVYYYSVFVNFPSDASLNETAKRPYFDLR